MVDLWKRSGVGLLAITALLQVADGVEAQASGDNPQAEQVRSVAELPLVRKAFAAIEELEPRSHEDLITLTEVPAPPFMEEERAAVFAEWIAEAGADSVWIDEEGNVIALREGRGAADLEDADGSPRRRRVVLGGHLDTVFPEGTDVTVQMRGDTLYAPGVGDDTRGMILVLTVLRAMEAVDLETEADVWFVGVVGEEGLGDLRGMKHLFREGAAPIDAWIEIDGGGLDRVVNQALGSHRYRVTFRGPGGHSWSAFGLANPAHALSRAIALFQDVADWYTRRGERTSYNVGRIGGGTSVNSIPFEAWAEVDMRSISDERLDAIDAALHHAAERALERENALRREGPPLELEMTMIGDRPSGELAAVAPLVQRAVAALELMAGEPPRLARSSTDANVPIALGVPAVTIGRGGVGGNAHALDEWWLNEDGHLAIQAALLLLAAEAGVAGPTP